MDFDFLNNFKVFLSNIQSTRDLLRILSDHPEKFINTVSEGKSSSIYQYINHTTIPCLLKITRDNIKSPIEEVSVNLFNDCILPAYKAKKEQLTCNDDSGEALILTLLLPFSWLILVILSCCCQKRKHLKPSCCWGHPAPVIPLNMLDNYKNRYGYMLAFGVTINTCIDALFGDYARIVGAKEAADFEKLPHYLSVFIKMNVAVLICITAYPFFIAQNMKNRFFGSILGFVYSLTYFILLVRKQINSSAKCWPVYERDNKKTLRMMYVLYDLPRLACVFALLVIFLKGIIETLYRRCKNKSKGKVSFVFQDDAKDCAQDYMYVHVKHVFQKHVLKQKEEKEKDKQTNEEVSWKRKIANFAKNKSYSRKPGFKYSTRVMISTFVGILAVYLITIQLCSAGYVYFHKYWNKILDKKFVQQIATYLKINVEIVQKHVDGLQASWWIALFLSIFSYAAVLLNSLGWYRKHVLMLRAGNRSFLPTSIKKGSLDSATLMTACLKFAGFQVGYSAWGFIINFLVLWLLSSFLSTFLVVPAFFGGPSFLINLIIRYWPTVLMATLTIIIQGQIAKRCFLLSEENVAVDNRRAFHITSYILFYFNVFIGIVSCLLRIAYGALLGIMFLQRLPKSTLPRSFERRDPGYIAYLGFLMVEHQHSNPVLQCFVRILLQHIDKDISVDEQTILTKAFDGEEDIELVHGIRDSCELAQLSFANNRKTRARNRWHLFVILIQNPSIRKYRSRYMKRKVTEKRHLLDALQKNIMTGPVFEIDENTDVDIDSVRNATINQNESVVSSFVV